MVIMPQFLLQNQPLVSLYLYSVLGHCPHQKHSRLPATNSLDGVDSLFSS